MRVRACVCMSVCVHVCTCKKTNIVSWVGVVQGLRRLLQSLGQS